MAMTDRMPGILKLAVERSSALTRILSIAALAAPLATCSAPPAQSSAAKVPITTRSPEARREFVVGRDLSEKLRATDAREHFEEAVRLDPDFALGYLGLATTAPSPLDVFPAMRRAAELAPRASPGEGHLIQAAIAAANGQTEVQAKELQALVASFPDDERVRFSLGVLYYARQEFDRAIDEFQHAIRIDPDYSPPYNLMGYALRNLERYERAEEAFRKYIELIPDEPNPYDSYAELLMKEGRFRDSIAEYQRALDVNPNFMDSYIGMGNDYIFLGQYEMARKCFTKLAYLARNDGERRRALTSMASSYIHEGRYDEALAAISKRLEIAHGADDRVAMSADLNLLGTILLGAGRPDEAGQKYQESVEMMDRAVITSQVKERTRRFLVANAARVALAKGDIPSATALAEKHRALVKNTSNFDEVWFSHLVFGQIALARRDWKQAALELEQANQQNPRVLYLEAQAYVGLGRTAEARTSCARAALYNGLDLNYGFVRNAALKLLAELENSTPKTKELG